MTRRRALKSAATAFAAPLFAAPATTRDVIHLDQEHQQIDNFGASDCWSMQRVGLWSDANRNRVADLLFSTTQGIGLSCWRFNIGAGPDPGIRHPWRSPQTFETGEGQYDWTRQEGESWFLAAAKKRGVRCFLAFVNSPPARMTRNGHTFCDAAGSTNLKPGYEPQFARYLVDIVDRFRNHPDPARRIAFDYLSPVNEPQWDWQGHSQEGMRASNADIKRITRALAAELKQRRSPTRISIMESGSIPDLWELNRKASDRWGEPYGNYLDEFAADPEMAPLMSGRIAYHDYGSDLVKGPLTDHRRTLAERMKRFPNWKLWMTEYCILVGSQGRGGRGRDLGIDTALDVARIIHLDLAVAGVAAWQWWTALSPEDYKDGLIYTGWKKPGDAETILTSKLLWVLGHYSRFIRPGMRRIGLAGEGHDVRGLMGSAYKDETRRRVISVHVNMAPGPRSVSLDYRTGASRWRLRSVSPYLTSARQGDDLKPSPALYSRGQLEVPARSVVTAEAAFA
jgi:O-glycosyl hydrolase